MSKTSVLALLLTTGTALVLANCSPRDAPADSRPPAARDLATRGFAKLRVGELAGARADFAQAIELDPKLAVAYSGLACVKDKWGDLRGALADVTRAIELSPSDASLFSSRGQIRARMGDLEGAIADYSLAIEVNPSDPEALSARGLARWRSRDFRGAAGDLDKVFMSDPANDLSRLFGFLSLALGEEGENMAVLWLEASLLIRGKEAEKGSWIEAVDRLLQGEITADELELAARASPVAERPILLCRSYFYSGMMAWIRSDLATAKVLLRKCLAMPPDVPERLCASAVLTWPGWSKTER